MEEKRFVDPNAMQTQEEAIEKSLRPQKFAQYIDYEKRMKDYLLHGS
ncbi:MAG: hypothetical protein LBF82_00020 [Lactobacillales bacterium]|jgi:Holliday junction resolvasome RuvABC ATP-dependent DNA helicase subunit|nr:hypothetical protein [Lactobacillales bacterium]